LAPYALAFSLVSIPWFIFGSVASSLMLPILSRAQEKSVELTSRYRACINYSGIGAVLLTLPLIIGGEQIVTLFYGKKYAGTSEVMGILSVTVAVRFLRAVPAMASMARADTKNQLYSNMWRAVSLPMAGVALLSGGGVVLVAVCSLMGESVATWVSFYRLRKQQGVPLMDAWRAVAYVLVFVATGLGLLYFGSSGWGYGVAATTVVAVLAVALVVAWFAFPEFALMVRGLIGKQRISAPQVAKVSNLAPLS
jgi:O-antigen/teichoic acid export membrane protein